MAPIEGRGVSAEWDPRLEQMIVTTSTQMPHVTKTGLADCLGLDEGQVRIVSPDVGGGFGYKGILLPEEIVCASIARLLGRPVRWLEDRFEQLTGANCREHHYVITAWADRAGKLLGVECEATVDAGAYSSYPFGACLEAAQIGSILPGPYVLPLLRCHTISACTNKPPILPYRGVARTGVCYAMETTLDALARQLGITAEAIRLANLVPPEAMPYRNLVGKVFDSGDYPESLRRAVAAFDLDAIRARQAKGEAVGFGLATFCEQGAHGTSVYHAWGIPFVPGFEQAYVRLSPDGVLEVRVGVHSHGQGMETTLAQVAHEILGVHPDKVRVVHGDTALTPYSTGTWGSRAMVMAGGAVAEACRQLAERIAAIGAALLQVQASDVEVADGKVRRKDTDGSVAIADVAHTWYRAPQNLPPGVNKGGLEVTAGYRPDPDTGTHSYACHACVVRVDTETGAVVLEDYLVVEDGGKLVNPMIVDGQVLGGLAQGIGTALYEEMPYDEAGQPLAATLADYLLPGTTDVPDVRLDHMETLEPLDDLRPEGHRRERRDRPAGRHRQRHQRRAGAARRRGTGPAGQSAARAGGHRGRASQPGNEARALRLCPAEGLAGGAEASSPPARGRAPARSRWDRCSIFAWRSPTRSPTCAICRTMPASRSGDGVLRIGAGTTHAAIEDGAVPGRVGEIMAAVARGIAYRPVRNRGTIGGSLAHADPGGRLGRRAAGARRHGDRARPAGRAAHCRGGLRQGHLRDRARRRRAAARHRGAGAAGRGALGTLEVLPQGGRVLQGHGLRAGAARPGAARRAGRARRAAAGDRGRAALMRDPAAEAARIVDGVPGLTAWRRAIAETALRRAVEMANDAMSKIAISLTVNGEPQPGAGRAARAARRPLARRADADRHACRLRAWRVRRLHRRDRRRAGALLHHPCRQLRRRGRSAPSRASATMR